MVLELRKHHTQVVTKMVIAKITKTRMNMHFRLKWKFCNLLNVFGFELEDSSFIDVARVVIIRDVRPCEHDFSRVVKTYDMLDISIASLENIKNLLNLVIWTLSFRIDFHGERKFVPKVLWKWRMVSWFYTSVKKTNQLSGAKTWMFQLSRIW